MLRPKSLFKSLSTVALFLGLTSCSAWKKIDFNKYHDYLKEERKHVKEFVTATDSSKKFIIEKNTGVIIENDTLYFMTENTLPSHPPAIPMLRGEYLTLLQCTQKTARKVFEKDFHSDSGKNIHVTFDLRNKLEK